MNRGRAEGRQAGEPTLESLLEQRRRIEAWLERLGAEGSEVPDHIAERVGADYRERLERVTRELATHREALEEEQRERRGAVEEAGERLAEARERLHESQLRHLVGEYDEETWSELRRELEQAVDAAEEELRIASDEAERVSGALAALEGGGGAPGSTVEEEAERAPESAAQAEAPQAPASEADEWEPHFSTEPDPEPRSELVDEPGLAGGAAPEEEAEALPWLDFGVTEGGEPPPAAAQPSSKPSPPPAEDDAEVETADLDFLRDLDRVLTGGGGVSPPPEEPAPAEQATPPQGARETTPKETAPQQGSEERLDCPECGASNDARAWYCEICGTELT
jgi:hypothetical protein